MSQSMASIHGAKGPAHEMPATPEFMLAIITWTKTEGRGMRVRFAGVVPGVRVRMTLDGGEVPERPPHVDCCTYNFNVDVIRGSGSRGFDRLGVLYPRFHHAH